MVLRASERNRQQTALEQGAAERFGALQKAINEDLLALELLGRFYAGSHKVERDEFHEFTRPIPKHACCLQALEWAPRVRGADRAAFEESVREAGFPGFQITEHAPAGEMVTAAWRAEYFPVDFIEPAEGNEPARGFDLASNAVCREALEQARDTGEMRGTAPIRLVQEAGGQMGFLAFLPVYRKGASTESVEDRRTNLEGFVLGVFRAGDLAERALAQLAPQGIDVALYDMSAPVGNRLLAWHSSRLRGKAAKAPDEADVRLPGTAHYAAALRPAGRTWLVLCTPSPEFFAGAGRWHPWEALIGGLAFTGLLAGYFATTLRRTAQIERLAGQLLESNEKLEADVRARKRAEEALREREEDLSITLHSIGDGVIVTDIDG
ncbi:MAG TPA: CHASE domain-containing protein, partial [Phycisphaerae bacterium]|nr:CHASE domain-containing protein [Phycisphaerae bacterium]